MRRLLADPHLRGVAAVVLDELHERHVATDLALAWLRRLRETRPARPGGGRDVGDARRRSGRRLPRRRRRAQRGADVRRRDRARRGAPTIGRWPARSPAPSAACCATSPTATCWCSSRAPARSAARRRRSPSCPAPRALAVLPLHGDMPLEEQARAVRPGDRRKVILSTNVAESSVTIDGVVAVIDSGLARIATHSPWTGLPTLAVAKISQAAATQRAGRAGRTRPGRALRLYTRHDFEQRPRAGAARDRARRSRRDAAGAGGARRRRSRRARVARAAAGRGLGRGARAARAAGRRRRRRRPDRRRPPHVAPPGPPAAGAPGRRGRGARLPRGGVPGRRADLRARHPRRRARVVRAPDRAGAGNDRGAEIVDLVDLFREAEAERFRPDVLRRLELDRRATEEVDRVRRQLVGSGGGAARRRRPLDAEASRALRLAVLAAFPDRVARRREHKSRAVVLAAGGAAELGFEASGDWLVTVDVEERDAGRGGAPKAPRSNATVVRLGSVIEPEWLLDLYPDRVEDVDRRAFNARHRARRTHHGPRVRRADARRDRGARPARRRDRAPARRRACWRAAWTGCPAATPCAQLLHRIGVRARRRCPRRRCRRWRRTTSPASSAPPARAGAASRELDDPAALVLATLPPRRAPRARHDRARTRHAGGRAHRRRPLRPERRRPGSNRACRTSSARAPCPPSAPAASR